jgi:hypothetical protein
MSGVIILHCDNVIFRAKTKRMLNIFFSVIKLTWMIKYQHNHETLVLVPLSYFHGRMTIVSIFCILFIHPCSLCIKMLSHLLTSIYKEIRDCRHTSLQCCLTRVHNTVLYVRAVIRWGSGTSLVLRHRTRKIDKTSRLILSLVLYKNSDLLSGPDPEPLFFTGYA